MTKANSELRDERLSDFESWFVRNGGYIHPNVQFAYSDAKGVHLRVKPTISSSRTKAHRGVIILSCPHSLSLSALNTREGAPMLLYNKREAYPIYDPQLFKAALDCSPRPQCIAAAWLCFQSHPQVRSWWGPYINCLPGLPTAKKSMNDRWTMGEVDTPLWWSADERHWMAGTNLEKGFQDLEKQWSEEWEAWEGKLNTAIKKQEARITRQVFILNPPLVPFMDKTRRVPMFHCQAYFIDQS